MGVRWARVVIVEKEEARRASRRVGSFIVACCRKRRVSISSLYCQCCIIDQRHLLLLFSFISFSLRNLVMCLHRFIYIYILDTKKTLRSDSLPWSLHLDNPDYFSHRNRKKITNTVPRKTLIRQRCDVNGNLFANKNNQPPITSLLPASSRVYTPCRREVITELGS